MNTHTPKHFVVQLGALLALYASLSSLLVLLFGIINIQFTDTAAYYGEGEAARGAIRFSIAALLVFFPAYLVLTRIANQMRRKETGGKYTVVARWLIFLSLLVAGGIMLGDLVVLINTFLDGEISKRFLIKVFALLLVVGVAFHYYLLDVRGYFLKRVDVSMYFAMGAVVMVGAALLYGFANIETPQVVREMRLDEKKVTDLQNIQWQIESYYTTTKELPENIAEAYGRLTEPTAPEGSQPYTYTTLSDTNYELCTMFTHPSSLETAKLSVPMIDANYNWEHSEGEWCFTRTIEVLEKPIR